MLEEMEESKDLHQRDSRAQTQNLRRIPNAFDSELTWQGFSSVGNGPDSTPCCPRSVYARPWWPLQTPRYIELHEPSRSEFLPSLDLSPSFFPYPPKSNVLTRNRSTSSTSSSPPSAPQPSSQHPKRPPQLRAHLRHSNPRPYRPQH